jgi:hypothetical protein
MNLAGFRWRREFQAPVVESAFDCQEGFTCLQSLAKEVAFGGVQDESFCVEIMRAVEAGSNGVTASSFQYDTGMSKP